MLALWLCNVAVAGPTFIGPMNELAVRAWSAAIACTGREAAAHGSVVIDVVAEAEVCGFAIIDQQGLQHIVLEGTCAVECNLVHEVAHSWLNRGIPVLTEAITVELASCISKELRLHCAAPRERIPDALLDRFAPNVRADRVSHATYLAARSYASVAHRTMGRALFSRTTWTWYWLDESLAAAGAVSLTGFGNLTSDAQRAWVSDQDADGLPAAYEQMIGTNATMWDTDGDGTWDGTVAPKGALVAPAAGALRIRCSRPTDIPVGGDADAHLPGRVKTRETDGELVRFITVSSEESFRRHPDAAGGFWLTPSGCEVLRPE